MKKFISAYLFILLSISQVYSQDYTPFDITETKWVMSRLVPSAGNNAVISFFEVYTKEDTIINDIQYTILATKNLCKLINSPNEVISDEDFIKEELEFGAIREEDKKIYFYRFDGVTTGYFNKVVFLLEPLEEYLIYDFNAIVGDTINHAPDFYTIIIDTYFNSDGVKVYEYINSSDESWAHPSDAVITEGKGSGDGLFAAFDSYYTSLICYKSDGPLDGIACSICKDYVTNTNDLFITDKNVLYPNPASTKLFVQEAYSDELENITVYSIQGELIRKFSFENGGHSIDLEELGLASGMVIFELEFANGKRKLEKIVILK